MPILELKCTHVQCQHRFEKVILNRDEFEASKRIPHACPKCPYAAEAVTSAPAPAKFKGTGFHQTDYDKVGRKKF